MITRGEITSLRFQLEITKFQSDQNLQLLEQVKKEFKPWQGIRFFPRKRYKVKIYAYDQHHHELFKKDFLNNDYGLFSIRIPFVHLNSTVAYFKIYECSYIKSIELFLGHFIPRLAQEPFQIVISDFDKTLLDTRYSTPKEMWESLKSPLHLFPTVTKSVQLIKSFIEDKYQPFILSASPHFYLDSIRDWLYQQQIFTQNILLKDYRKIFSFSSNELTPKDIKKQGFYKMNHLIHILQMCQSPSKIVLMGDSYESDLIIYSSIRALIHERIDHYILYKTLIQKHHFTLNSMQTASFLLDLAKLQEMTKIIRPEIEIYIRCLNGTNAQDLKQQDLGLGALNKQLSCTHFYS
jgi:phosphatidate phosphatase APP1